jgi:hypothetical protein
MKVFGKKSAKGLQPKEKKTTTDYTDGTDGEAIEGEKRII